MQLDPLVTKGWELPEPKYEQAKLPPDITALSSDQLAEMFTVLTGWADFFATKLVQAQLAEKDAEKKLDRHIARLTVEKMGSATKGDRVTLIKAQIACDPDVQDLEDSHRDAYAMRKAWEVMLTNQERDITLVSREITRRTSERMRRDI
jgi:hypothetical protein